MNRMRLGIIAALVMVVANTTSLVPASAEPPVSHPLPMASQATTTLLEEDFHTLNVGTSFAEGAPIGTTFTDVFNGLGSQTVTTDGTDKFLTQRPGTSISSGETHASLATSRSSFSGSYTLLAEYGNETQLRAGSAPNPWERGWLLFDYQDNNHFYAVVLKTNGWQLSREYHDDTTGAQRECFLASGTAPTYRPGSWKRIVVTQTVTGTTTTIIKVQARTGSSTLATLATYVDNGKAADCPGYQQYTSGRVGLYNEDAEVDWGWVNVTR